MSLATITVRPSELAAVARECLALDLPTIVDGPPGGGKTSILSQVAADAGYALAVAHPVVEDPTYATGLPWPTGDGVTFRHFGMIERLLRSERPIVGFLDDLGQAPPSVQAAYMRPLLSRELADGTPLPSHVRWFAATNRREDQSGVLGILRAVANRCVVVHLTANVEDWQTWAIREALDPRVIGFLGAVPAALYEAPSASELAAFPSPRQWERVARAVERLGASSTRTALLAGLVGSARAIEFAAFCDLADAELPSWDSILREPSTVKFPERRDLLYAVAAMFAGRIDASNADRIAPALFRLPTEYRVFAFIQALRDPRRSEGIMGTACGLRFGTEHHHVTSAASPFRGTR